MGIDCMLFAEKSKRCVWIDRHYNVGRVSNLERHGAEWWLGFLEGIERATNGDDWSEAGVGNRARARLFIREHGDQPYFVVTDSHEPNCHDVARSGGYTKED